MNESTLLDFPMTREANSFPGETPADGVVYVVDDEIQVLEVVEMQLRAAGYNVVTFDRATKFLASIQDLSPGVIISDQKMPELNGLEFQRSLMGQGHRFQVIILSGFPETRVAVQAMKQGAVTVLDKPYSKDELLSAIAEAFAALEKAKGEDRGLPASLPNGEQYLDRLSKRERQVIDHVFEGDTNKAIGISLGISIKTVEKHRGKAMKKMAVSSLAELIRLMNRELGHS